MNDNKELSMASVKDIPIGLQLFSIRHECEKDGGKNFPNVVRAVAKMGYQGVEFAGYYGWSAKDIRKILDDNGLPCCGAHVGLDTLMGDELKKSIEFHTIIGNKFLIVPGLAEKHRNSAAAWAATAKLFSGIAEQLRPHGMRTGYHNHDVEFRPMDGKIPWDVFFGSAAKDVVMQLDIGNAIQGGADCAALLRKYPGRAGTLHIKEYGGTNEAVIGEGEVNWKELLPLIAKVGGTDWNIVEHERDPNRALSDVDKCLQFLRRTIAEL
jgi:sugar phosphate isomerase/epimerase